ncbi:MAG: redoxin domain-containing protein [Sedimentisphaerales bacterium]|nr:redoxin domain-containing protein [Sedimentisphaerales bacterium]
MKGMFVWLIAAGLVASLARDALSQSPQAPPRPRPPDAVRTPQPRSIRPAAADSVRLLARQIETLKARHQEDIRQFESLHALALEEKATRTAQRVTELIQRRQMDYQSQLAALEKRIERIGKPDAPAAVLADPNAPAAPAAGRAAPNFTLAGFDGRAVRLSDLRGKIVVLEWCNFACPYSIYHYDTKLTMVTLAQKYQAKNVVWLAINSTHDATPQANRDFAQAHKLPYPVLDDSAGPTAKSYGALTTPHMFVIDPAGRIAYEGAIDNAPLGAVPAGQEYINYVDEALRDLIDGKPRVGIARTIPYGCAVSYPQ